jgi:hypothetical protein
MPDAIIFDTLDALSVLFNTPQTGSLTVLTCGNGSGIQRINDQTGPSVTLVGTSGITVLAVAPNQINIGFDGSITQSGVIGVNGISVHQIGGSFVIDGAALSGIGGGSANCFESGFTSITSGLFQHNFGTRSLVVQITDNSSPPRAIMPDAIIFDTLDAISVLFNTPQTGSVTVLTCGSGSGVGKFSQALTDVVSANIMHGLASEDVLVQVRDASQDVTIPDRIRILDSDTVSLQFNTSFTGRVVIVG